MNSANGEIFAALMELHDHGPFSRFGAPFINARVNASLEGRTIDFKQKDRIHQVDELVPVPRTATEESLVGRLIGYDRFDLLNIPNVMVVDEIEITRRRNNARSGVRVTLISENAIAMQHVITAAFQFGGDGGLSSTRATLYEIVSQPHHQSITSVLGWLKSA